MLAATRRGKNSENKSIPMKINPHACYIMTITVLKPYRRYGIASQLLEQAIKDCMQARNVSLMTLHV